MLVITSVREDLRAVSHIMEKADIAVFSVSETVGHKTEFHEYLPHNWFGTSLEGTHAYFFFSFTDDSKATQALEMVREFNKETGSRFPVRAFVLPVDQCSY